MRYELLAMQLIRALRGKRSQPQLSRRLGLRGNPVYRWESGRAWPTAQRLFAVARLAAPGYVDSLRQFFGSKWQHEDLETREGLQGLLSALAGNAKASTLAAQLKVSRFVVSRWLAGKCEIRLPMFLHFVDVTTQRLLDFLTAFVDPLQLPVVSLPWKRLCAARATAYDVPWSHAVLRVLELSDYANAAQPDAAWIARRLSLPEPEVARCLEQLVLSGQVVRRLGRYRVRGEAFVDTGVNLQRRSELRAFWTRIALERLASGTNGLHAFNVFSIAERDLPQLRALQVEFFERMRTLIQQSTPSERVVVYSAQLVPLDTGFGP